MQKIIKTLLLLAIILPIITLANTNQASANNEEKNQNHMTAEEIPQPQTDATEKLYKLGLFREVQENEDGTPNFALNYYTTRIQGLKIFNQFTATEQQARNSRTPHSFKDLNANQNPYVSYALENNYIHGVSRTHYEPTAQLTADHFITTALIILEYNCGADFEWSNPYPTSNSIALTYNQFNEENNNISRGEIAVILLNMLTTELNNQEQTLLDKFIENNVFETLAKQNQINSGKFLTAIETQDKEKIKEAALAIINGTDCDYETHCCNICCDCGALYFDNSKPHHQEPIFKQKSDSTENNSNENQTTNNSATNNNPTNNNSTNNTTPNNSNNSGAAATTSPPPQTQTPPTTTNPPDNNTNPNNPETPNTPENNCNCDNCATACDCDNEESNDCSNCDCENDNTETTCTDESPCNKDNCTDCNPNTPDICTDPDCNNTDCLEHGNINPQEPAPDTCTDEKPCNKDNCADCNPNIPDICTDSDCNNPDCPEHGNTVPQEPEPDTCTDENPCNKDDCPDCNANTPDICTNPDCNDPDCTEHDNSAPQESDNCTDENPCNEETCQNCNDISDICTDPDCNNLDCTEHGNSNTGDNCDNPFDCTDPDCDHTDCDGSCGDTDCPAYINPDTWPKSLLEVTDEGREVQSSSVARWVKTTDIDELPTAIGGTPIYTDAIKTTSCFMSLETRRVYELDKTDIYHTLSFTAYNTTDYIARIQVIDYDTNYLLWSINLDSNSNIEALNINISKTQQIEFSAELLNTPTASTHYQNAVILCDPRVDKGTMHNTTPSENPVSFLSATDSGERISSGSTSRWHKVINRDELPNSTHTEALKTSSLFMRQNTITAYTLDREYKTLEFTAYNLSPFEIQLVINNADTNVAVLDTIIPSGTSREITADILNATKLEFRAHFPTAPHITPHTFNALYLCDPVLYLQPTEDICDGCEDPDCKDCDNTVDPDNYIITPDFTDPNFLADVRGFIGKQTGDIYLSDVNRIADYWVLEPGIKDFAGIEHFHALMYLTYKPDTDVVEKLDVSKNLNLRFLEMPHQNLTELDLSNNTSLYSLHVPHNNLQTLILPKESELFTLNIWDNPLTHLDLTNQHELVAIYAYRIDVTELDLTQLPKCNW